MGFLLYIVASLLYPLGKIVGILFAIPQYKSFREADEHYGDLALYKDQYLNASMKYFFNATFIKDRPTVRAYRFGNGDESISSAIGKNYVRGTLTEWGLFWRWVLHLLERNHSVKAIEEDEFDE